MMGGQIAHCGTMFLMLILYNVIILRSLMYNSVNNIKVCHTPPKSIAMGNTEFL